MFKRLMLALTFIATLGVVGVGVTEKAEAWGRWRSRPFIGRYYGPPTYYYDGYVPYRTSYRGYYGPRYYQYGGPYYGEYYPYYDDYYGSYYGGFAPRRGVSVSFGF